MMMVTVQGADDGLAPGALQAALSNLQTLCQAAAPLLWGRLYTLGLEHKPTPQPGRFYRFIGAAALLQLMLTWLTPSRRQESSRSE